MIASFSPTPARVVVTGMGCIAPSGAGVDALWESLVQGRGNIGPRSDPHRDDAAAGPAGCHWSASVPDAALQAAWPGPGRAGAGDRAGDLLTVAADEALRQAHCTNDDALGADVPVIIGTGGGPTQALFEAYRTFFTMGAHRTRPTTVPRCIANSLSSRIAIRYHLTGPNYVIVSACASATTAIGTAFRMIRQGLAQRALCGGTEAPFDPATISAWNRIGMLTRSDNPAQTVLPFDRRRDGFVLGEGAGVLVLESLASALERGVPVLGEITGFGESSDATHPTQPDPDGQARSMLRALQDAGITPAEISLIVGHGTATRANDLSESQALQQVFGDGIEHIPVLALKPLFGHLLGASGAIEALLTIRTLRAQVLPPDPLPAREPDPACPLLFCPDQMTSRHLDYAMKNSFAFGGNNAVIIFRAIDPHPKESPHGP